MKKNHLPHSFATIDIGNSKVTAKLPDGTYLQETRHAFKKSTPHAPFSTASRFEGEKIICSVVDPAVWGKWFPQFFQWLQLSTGKIHHLSYWRKDRSFFEMPVHYALTLGEDRLALAYAAYWRLHPSSELTWAITLDAGTMLTIDLIQREHGFQGGYILPGQHLYRQSLQQGNQLQNQGHQSLETQMKLPQTTEQAMEWGYKHAVCALLTQVQSHYKLPPSQGILLCTGSDGADWRKWLDSILPYECEYHPHLLHDALGLIAQKEAL